MRANQDLDHLGERCGKLTGMMKMSAEQLRVLQDAFAVPVPALSAPPELAECAQTFPQQKQQKQYQQLQSQQYLHNQSFQAPRGYRRLPLVVLPAFYLAYFASVAAVSLAARDWLVSFLLSSFPVFAVALAVHAAAVHCSATAQGAIAARCLAALIVALCPSPFFAPDLRFFLVPCVVLSVFFAIAVCAHRVLFTVCGVCVFLCCALCAGILLSQTVFHRPLWAAVLAVLAVQSATSTARLRSGMLCFDVSFDQV